MYVITVFDFEGRPTTALHVGCEGIAETTLAAVHSLGLDAKLSQPDRPRERGEAEVARAQRLSEKLAPIIFG